MFNEEGTTAAQEATGTEASTTTTTTESTPQTENSGSGNQAQTESESGTGEAARAEAQQVNGGTAAPETIVPPTDARSEVEYSFVLPGERPNFSPDRHVGTGILVTYKAGEEERGHSGVTVGDDLAAIVVRGGSLPNLKVFASGSDATLFKENVPYGNGPGQWRF